MKKCLLLGIAIGVLGLCACSGTSVAEPPTAWDCSVVAAEDNTDDSYIITYSNEEIFTPTGQLTMQNQNEFPITIHLQTSGEKEVLETVQPGGYCTRNGLKTDAPYTVGIHADVHAGTEIAAMVYDGAVAFPY